MKPMLRSTQNIAEVRQRIQIKYKADLGAASTNEWNRANIENKYDGLLTITDNCSTVSEIKKFIKELDMHQDGASNRKLMTIHAAKGLETETVYFLHSNMCEYFKDRAGTQWEKQQEDNLYYVACTRALDNLIFLD
jgi:DNA helicase-2/ATP-dependent DNA helicase PcrA